MSDDESRIDWGENERTDQEHFDNASSRGIEAVVAPDRIAGLNTLQYRFGLGSLKRVQYQQLMFAEYQRNDGNEFALESHFAAVIANDDAGAFLIPWSLTKPTRMWSFNQDRINDVFVPTFPATDDSLAGWYNRFMRLVDAVDWGP